MWWLLLLVLSLCGLFYLFVKSSSSSKTDTSANEKKIDKKTDKPDVVPAVRNPRRTALDRMRQQAEQAENNEIKEDNNEDEEEAKVPFELEGLDMADLPDDLVDALRRGAKLSKEQDRILDKARKKNMKEEQRQAIEARNNEKKRKEELLNEKSKKKEDERLEKERKIAEEQAKKLEDERKNAENVLDEWKSFITTDNSGSFEADVAQESQGLLAEFVEYIKTKKVVVLEDLAAHFELRTQDVVKRISSLELSGAITGVNDDRGKYIYITPEEMEKVALFIEKSGRIKIEDIVAKSNQLIRLK